MPPRQPLPRLWLMTDERIGDRLFDALEQLPQGTGIVFRHYSLGQTERRALFDRVARLARQRAHLLLLAGDAAQAELWGADGSHGPGPAAGLRTAPAHDLAEIRSAESNRAAAIFLSPVFPTRSHPGAATLGPAGFDALARRASLPVIALGGMSAQRFEQLEEAYGWAAIDAWLD